MGERGLSGKNIGFVSNEPREGERFNGGGERELWRSGMTSFSDLKLFCMGRAGPGNEAGTDGGEASCGAGDDAGRRWVFSASSAALGGWFSLSGL